MQKTAVRGAVMAGAEGKPRLDLDPDVVYADAGAIMGAMNEKTPGPHGLQAGERIRYPVALLREAKGRGARRLIVRRRRDQRPHRLLVRRKAEISFHHPCPAAARPALLGLEDGRRRLARLEALGDEVCDGAGAALVADEAELMRGIVGRQAFEHIPSPMNGRRWREPRDEGKPGDSQTLIRPRVPRVHLLPQKQAKGEPSEVASPDGLCEKRAGTPMPEKTACSSQ